MTTSAVRTNDRKRGFTLLEIVVVLAIAALIVAGAAGLMVYSSDERALREASGEIEVLAKRARTVSILHQTPYALEFHPGLVRLMPLAEAGSDEKKTALGRSIGGERVIAANSRAIRQDYSLPAGMELSLRRWNDERWIRLEKNVREVWRFDPDGLCEPVSVRLNLDQSWAVDTFHPLTATIRSSELEAR